LNRGAYHAFLQDIEDDDTQSDWESGPLATLRFMRLCYPHLKGGGCIVNVSSGVTNTSNPAGLGVYAALKAAIVMLMRTVAVEWGHGGIRANAIAPMALSSQVESSRRDCPEMYQAFVASSLLGRIAIAVARPNPPATSVALPAEELGDLGLHGGLHDQPDPQPRHLLQHLIADTRPDRGVNILSVIELHSGDYARGLLCAPLLHHG